MHYFNRDSISRLLGLASLLLCLVPISLLAQEEVETLHVFYIDNSDIERDGGLGEAQVTKLEELIETATRSSGAKVFVYQSNGTAPMLTYKKAGLGEITRSIYSQITKYPKYMVAEVGQVLDAMNKLPVTVTGNIHIHFFLSPAFFEEIPYQIPYLSGLLPKYIHSTYGSSTCRTTVALYYESSKSEVADLVQKNLTYCNQGKGKINPVSVTYAVTKL